MTDEAVGVDPFAAVVGQPDAYPFLLSAPAIEKLRFVHQTIAAAEP